MARIRRNSQASKCDVRSSGHVHVQGLVQGPMSCSTENFAKQIVLLLDLTEEFQALDKDDSEILIKNGWLTVAGGGHQQGIKIPNLTAVARPCFSVVPLYDCCGDMCPYELKTNPLRNKNI